jgi:hypothetical protein
MWARAALAVLASVCICLFEACLEDVRLYSTDWSKSETEAGYTLAAKQGGPLKFVVVPDESIDIEREITGFDAINSGFNPFGFKPQNAPIPSARQKWRDSEISSRSINGSSWQ